nr:autophagy-related protein 8i [Ipomoea trifida]
MDEQEEPKMREYCVTGGTGLIGSYLVKSLLDKGYNLWYAYAKTMAEQEAWKWADEQNGGIKLVVVNLSFVVGPLLTPQPTSTLQLIFAIVKGLIGEYPNKRVGFVHIEDAIQPIYTSSGFRPSVGQLKKKKMGKDKTSSFKQQFSLEERLQESQDMIAKYPDRLPVVVERYSKTDLPEMEKKKYLVPRDMSIGQFIHILSVRLHLAPGKALFVFVENTLPQTSAVMDSVYESFKDEDGFLYMCYSSEKTFGAIAPN